MKRVSYVMKSPLGDEMVTVFWKNFINDIHEHTVLPNPVWRMIKKRLGDYRAEIVGEHYIQFEHEEDATLFLLRWS